MENGPFTMAYRVQVGLGLLTPEERAEILARVADLADRPPERWQERGAVRLSTDEPLYLLRIDDSLRVIVRAADGAGPHIEDVVRRELLQWVREAGGAASA